MSQPEGASRGRALAAAAPLGGWRAVFNRWLILPAAAIGALVIGAVIIAVMGADPLTGYHALISGAFGGSYQLASTAVKAVPLLLVGVGICISFRANVLNIGGEGQIVMGGLASAATALALPNLPGFVLIPLVLLAGAAGGAIWGAIPGAFKAYRGVNEVLSTIMLNLVAVQLMNYLLAGPMIDRTELFAVVGRIPQTRLLSPNSWLPIIVPGTQLHLGVVIAVLVAVAAWVLLRQTGLRVPHPRRRAVHRRGQLRGDGRQADHDAGPDPVRGDVRAGRRDARVRQHQPPDGDRRLADRVHRQRRLLRDRCRAVRRPQPAVDDPVRVPVRRPAGRRRLDGHRTERALLL